MCLCISLMTGISIKAGDYVSNALRLPYGKNYLDLRNIQRTEPRDFDMHTHIKIKTNTTYTLVMDLDFIGIDNFSQDENPYLTHCDKANVNCQTKDMTVDLVNERWHYSFLSTTDTLLLRDIPAMGTTGYNIMLYEGTYAQFNGFEYYVSNMPIHYHGVYLMDYDHPVSETEIRSQISVSDPKGGPIKVDLMGGDFEGIENGIGEYYLQYRAMDAMSNTSYYEMTIMIIDKTKPTLTGINAYSIEHNKPLELNAILSQLTVSDNYDQLNTSHITVVRDTYTPNKNRTGTYEIDFSLKDSSQNETIKTVSIQVIDIFSPVITGPDVIYTYLSDGARTLEQIKSLYTALDDHDGDVTSKIVVNMSNYNGSMINSHEIYVTCKDAAGNEKVRTVHIHVIDDTAPVFHNTDYVLTYDDYEAMTKAEIIAWIEAELSTSGMNPKNIKILLDEAEHIQGKRDKAYLYYSYEVEGVTYQSRIQVAYKQNTTIPMLYVYAAMGAVGIIGSSYLVIKRIKKRT